MGGGELDWGSSAKKINGATIMKRRAALLKKASQLSVLCDCQIAIILISADSDIFEYATHDMTSILKRLNDCMKSHNHPALKFKPEGDALSKSAEVPSLKKRKLLRKGLKQKGVHELHALEKELTKGMLLNKNRKSQILTEQLKQSRMKEQQALQRNLSLQKMVEELQGVSPSIVCPEPLSVRFPETEGNADTSSLPSTSYAAPLSIRFPEAEGNADTSSLPSTSYAAPLSIRLPEAEGNADSRSLPSIVCPAPLSVRFPETEGKADTKSLPFFSYAELPSVRFPEKEGKADTRSLPFFSYAALPSVRFPETEGNADTRILPSIFYPAPLSVAVPQKEGNAGTRFLPSTSYAAPLATDKGPEPERSVRPAHEDWGNTLSLVCSSTPFFFSTFPNI